MMAVLAAKRAAKATGQAVPKGRAGKKRASLQPKATKAISTRPKREGAPKQAKRKKRNAARSSRPSGAGVIGTSSGASSSRRQLGSLFI